jgi:hypothetical protein
MKTLATILALLFFATPAFAKTECSTKSSPSAHYRLIDGKRCWYQGAGLDKSQLTWSRSNATANSLLPSHVDDTSASPDNRLASLDRAVLCGEVSWGHCAPSFADRWRIK